MDQQHPTGKLDARLAADPTAKAAFDLAVKLDAFRATLVGGGPLPDPRDVALFDDLSDPAMKIAIAIRNRLAPDAMVTPITHAIAKAARS